MKYVPREFFSTPFNVDAICDGSTTGIFVVSWSLVKVCFHWPSFSIFWLILAGITWTKMSADFFFEIAPVGEISIKLSSRITGTSNSHVIWLFAVCNIQKCVPASSEVRIVKSSRISLNGSECSLNANKSF